VTLRLALRSLAARPVRSAVLSGGFGLGIAVMASLLGIGDVILDQARAPELAGGGDVRIAGASGRVPQARFLMSSVFAAPPLAGRALAAAPGDTRTLYLLSEAAALPLRARGGIPSLERALQDPETATVAAWQDTVADRGWVDPDPAELLRGMDRFHSAPQSSRWSGSWAEWLYFNGSRGDDRFYLSFIVGAPDAQGRVDAVVRLQFERDGTVSNFSDRAVLDGAEVLAGAPDLDIGGGSVRLEGLRYHIRLDLPREPAAVSPTGRPAGRARGEIVLEAIPGRSMTPLTVRGAAGWLSGYVVPVLSGAIEGTLEVDGARLELDGGTGYHDHNWGFWQDVSWRWGQVASGGLSFVFGRIYPPAEAADADRLPGFMAVLGPNGPLGYSMDVTIRERGGNDLRPETVEVVGRGEELELRMQLAVDHIEVSRVDGPMAGGRELDFIQMRATYRVQGRVGARAIDFVAEGSAETFRGE